MQMYVTCCNVIVLFRPRERKDWNAASEKSVRLLPLHRRLLPGPRRRAEFDRLHRLQPRLALPVGHLFEGPGSRLAGEGEVEVQQGSDLAGFVRGGGAVELLDDED